MMTEGRFHFRIRVGDIEVEATGPEEYVKDVRNYAEQLVSSSLTRIRTMGAVATPVSTVSEPSTQPTIATGQPLGKDESVVEFLERVPNRTHQDKILAFAYFLEKNRQTASFGVKEINDVYNEVREAASNTAQYFILLVKSGLIMRAKKQPSGGPAQYVLTRKGEATIKNALSRANDA